MTTSPDATPEITSERGRLWIWLIPFIAALLGAWLVWQHYSQRGTLISVQFETAEGLVPGKTEVRFKDLTIGILQDVVLTPDLERIEARIRIQREMENHLKQESRFWVVRPRIGPEGISGFHTLLSGAYIAMEPGNGPSSTFFKGLESPPLTPAEAPGVRIVLCADMGVVEVGTPIYFRKIPVGNIEARHMTEDQTQIELEAFIRAPYDQQVTAGSRFWNQSGIDMTLDANGIQFRTDSLDALLSGGIAFDNPDPSKKPAQSGTKFPLFPNFQDISKESMKLGTRYILYFDRSVRGLVPGAPIDFKGVQIGEVLEFHLAYDMETDEVRIPVLISILTEKLAGPHHPDPNQFFAKMVERGLRARLESASLLTGQLFIAMEMEKEAPEAKVGTSPEGMPTIPTMPHPIEKITEDLTGLLERIQNLPIERVVENTADTIQSIEDLSFALQKIPDDVRPLVQDSRRLLQSVEETVRHLDITLEGMQENGPLYQELTRTTRELNEAARAIRLLADTLEQRPDTVLYGK